MAKKPLSGRVKALLTKPKKGEKKDSLVSVRNIARVELMYQAIRLRRDGYTILEIATALDVVPATIHQYLLQMLNQATTEFKFEAEQERQLQVERLDQLIRVFTPYAVETHKEKRIDSTTGLEIVVSVPPSPIYANLLLNIEQRRAKLLALDVPETKNVAVTGIREYVGVDLDKV